MHGVCEFNEILVRSGTGAMSSTRTWSAQAHNPHFNEALVHAAGAPVVPKQERSPRPCGVGPGGPITEKAPSPMRRGPRWSQSEGGPRAHAAGASVVP